MGIKAVETCGGVSGLVVDSATSRGKFFFLRILVDRLVDWMV